MFNRPVERAAIVRLCLILLVVFICLFSVPAYAQSQPQVDLTAKKVLIVNSFENNQPAFLGIQRGLSNALQSGGIPILNQFFEFLDLRRNTGPEQRKLLVEEMRVRYGDRRPDMIITVYAEALEFVLKDCRDVLPAVPILALILPQGFDLPKRDRRIIGQFSQSDIIGTLEIALKLVPGARRVYLVGGAHPIDKIIEDRARRDFKKWETRLEFIYLSHMPLEDMLNAVSKAPRGSIILTLSFSRDVTGTGYTTPEVVERLSRISTAPIFGVLDTTFGHGIVGGFLFSFEHTGTKAGELVLNILSGRLTEENFPERLTAASVPMFDWRQLRRWNLNEDALPKGSVIINREFTLWDYRYYLIGILALCLAETALIIFLVIQRRRKKSAEAKYRRIFEGGLEGIYETSVEGKSLTANPAMVKMLGYDSEDEVRSSITDLANQLWVNPNERLKYTQLLETQDVVRGFEAQIWRKDRTKIWVSINGRRVYRPDGHTLLYSAFVEDITERKRAEAALRESQERFRQVAENIGDFIWEVDAQGLYRYTSPSVKRILGYSPDELVGKMHFYDLFTPEVREELKTAAFGVFAAKQPFRAFPNLNLSKDGRVVHLETSGSPVLDATGNLTGYIGVDSDVTERQKLEAHLQQTEKMESLGTLTGGIAHDFNNILAAITGFTELVKGKVPTGSKEERYLQMVMEAGLRGRELIKQMLMFSRQMPQEKKPLLLSNIVNETGRFLRASIPSTISIRVNVESESGFVLADPVQIQQVLTNLSTNAAHAMREKGGTLDIALSDFSVSSSNGDPHGIAPGLYMRLTVRDAGVGIPREIVDKIFDPFFTTKKLGEGTGLGLSVVMGIVKQSQGYITVESEPGKGSTFTVYFPKVAERPVADAAAGEEPIPTGSERILFVDDEKPLVEMGEALLAELGYKVTSRTSSRQALELLKQDASRFDLVITDQTMPEITGVELAREILAIRPELPVILCTGFSHLVNADFAKAAGIRAFVMKPLTKGEIARTIRAVLDG